MKRELGAKKLVEVFQAEKVLDLDAVKRIIDSGSRMTVFRKLKNLGYHSSYSHHGKYYTLCSIARFDKNGLWSYGGVHFSKYGSLMGTIPVFVKRSEAGCFASELAGITCFCSKCSRQALQFRTSASGTNWGRVPVSVPIDGG